jgi:hypothetical protein
MNRANWKEKAYQTTFLPSVKTLTKNFSLKKKPLLKKQSFSFKKKPCLKKQVFFSFSTGFLFS